MRQIFTRTGLAGVCLAVLPWIAAAQTAPGDQQPADQKPADQASAAPAAPAAPAPLPTPSITGPLSGLPPAIFDAGPFGKIAVNGFLSGMGLAQTNHVPGDNDTQGALSNGQVFIQKTDGWFQFYLQAGAYDILALGTPFLATDKTISDLYGPIPVAFLKLQAGKNTSFEIGSLPTLMGAEYTFSFENMNIERGLLWNQENAVNRGIQVNQTMGKFTASLSWNDGFYSNRYSYLSGSLTYANGPHSLAFVGMGNLGQTKFQTLATPLQNNGSMYVVVYTYTKGAWIIQPYYQYSSVPTNLKVGVVKGASTNGGAILLSRAFKKGFSLPVRWEYIGSSGSAKDNAVNLMYGPGSTATSITVTPTFQYGGFFFRGDIGYVHVGDMAPGAGFGPLGLKDNQTRVVGEIGFVFGNNISPEKKP
ncbi:MAG TPA: outer membrane beta-barrel protein [Bryobacteraceae bacterium]|nr:outer membrane beta-barrel protein [Bryobacteraceae bacterium]